MGLNPTTRNLLKGQNAQTWYVNFSKAKEKSSLNHLHLQPLYLHIFKIYPIIDGHEVPVSKEIVQLDAL